uniref:hypothetical protein n=1 Tax=Enterocloster clostridioformis TaxID=1531 RepID=UPI0026EF346C
DYNKKATSIHYYFGNAVLALISICIIVAYCTPSYNNNVIKGCFAHQQGQNFAFLSLPESTCNLK